MRWWLATAVLLAGCEEALPLPEVEFSTRCDGRDLRLCDVRTDTCHQRYLSYTACLMEAEPGPLPFVEVIDLGTFEDRLRANPPVAPGPDGRDRGLALLELLEPGVAWGEAVIQQQLALAQAQYSIDRARITIIDRGDRMNSRELISSLSHEIVHALQDRRASLRDFLTPLSGTVDGRLSALSVVEGEAEFYQQMVGLALDRANAWTVDWDSYFSSRKLRAAHRVEGDASPIVASAAWFPYSFGGHFVTRAWKSGQGAAVTTLFDRPPTSSAEVMTAPGHSESPPEDITGAPALGAALADYALVSDDVLGQWHVWIFLRRFIDPNDAWLLAQKWRGDHVWIYENSAGDVATIWRMRLDDDAAAGGIAATLDQRRARWATGSDGAEAVLVACDELAELPEWELAAGL